MFLSPKITGAFLMTLAGLAIIGTQARADLQFNASSIVGSVFTYDLNFNTTLDASTGLSSQRLQAGNYATIYDLEGFSSAAINPAYSSFFTLTTQEFGVTPGGTLPGDDTPMNVTLTYTGPTLASDQSFGSILSVTTTSNTINPSGQYASQVTINSGAANGLMIGNIGSVAVPGIPTNASPDTPEPGSLAFVITAGLSGSVFAWRRRRVRK